ncbi:MAG: hypothetical protein L0387_30325 [Acidobacteria bacterium]|nr:hypothetical protein [Acidobacteriota bacterium]
MKIYLPAETPVEAENRFQYNSVDLPGPVTAIRYYMPLEICLAGRPSGLYHFCCYVYPANVVSGVGYCAEGCTGHASKEQARQHYRDYLIDRFGRYNRKCNTSSACAICGRIATQQAWIDYHFEWETYPLCAMHMTRSGFGQVFLFDDYHLLQISDPRDGIIATVSGQEGPISITRPFTHLHWADLPAPDV